MSHSLQDRVLGSSTTTGTPLVVGGSVTGFRSLSAVLSDGDLFDALVQEVDGSFTPSGAWETGTYQWAAAGSTATLVELHGSSSGSAISWGAGVTKLVSFAVLARHVVDHGRAVAIAARAFLP